MSHGHCMCVTGVLFIKEQVWGAVRSGSEETGPGLFQKVGPLVADWENYLRDIAVELDTQTHGQTDGSKPLSQEESLFLQVGHSELNSSTLCKGHFQSLCLSWELSL